MILVVDDDRDIRNALQEAFEMAGYETVTALNGQAALQLLIDEGLRPDMILLDLMMPEMNGIQFLEIFRETPELAKIPVLVATAFSESDLPVGSVAAFIRKPLHLRTILSYARQYVGPPKESSAA
jgi:two-component system chemotaxis response regulator CheY